MKKTVEKSEFEKNKTRARITSSRIKRRLKGGLMDYLLLARAADRRAAMFEDYALTNLLEGEPAKPNHMLDRAKKNLADAEYFRRLASMLRSN